MPIVATIEGERPERHEEPRTNTPRPVFGFEVSCERNDRPHNTGRGHDFTHRAPEVRRHGVDVLRLGPDEQVRRRRVGSGVCSMLMK
jgi:hypothetical protein